MGLVLKLCIIFDPIPYLTISFLNVWDDNFIYRCHFLTWPYKVDIHCFLKKKLCKFGSYNFIGNFNLFFIDTIYTENDHRFCI